MEKTIVVEFNNTKMLFEIIGSVELPVELIGKNFNIYISEKYRRLTFLYSDYIYDSISKIRFVLCIDYKAFEKPNKVAALSPYNSPFTTHNIIKPKSSEELSELFYYELESGRINFKSYFRKNRIDKILETEPDDTI